VGRFRPPVKASEVAWLTTDEVLDRMVEAFAVRLLDARSTDGPHVRIHDGAVLLRER
jgi:8-oxo-dGTP diphosphatase